MTAEELGSMIDADGMEVPVSLLAELGMDPKGKSLERGIRYCDWLTKYGLRQSPYPCGPGKRYIYIWNRLQRERKIASVRSG